MSRKTKAPIAIYSALADATRCRIVEILLRGPIPVHTLADAFSISRPAISRHLRVLKTAGLVAEVKKGRENLYALRPAKLGVATAWIGTIVSPQAADDAVPEVAIEQPRVAMPEVNSPQPAITAEPVAAAQSEAQPEADSRPPALPAARRQKADKADKARAVQPEPAINQMGFDF
ncbi:ArsR/SmtB family transcription factor [Devosia sediminis]|uniref:Metalloregulator ArsR/SmtB family transcription factor n=1 Tax=Devosia sediminis TaxID=2798801 RepID=A0A934IRK5_9HYPH|nr:metalloregulator ArsR/SmtB family transcription factor [Devosia sediminis]MBJ3785513.1 metalloregulator ArsR/SmtB family transcription factor [Devosia sediminis]